MGQSKKQKKSKEETIQDLENEIEIQKEKLESLFTGKKDTTAISTAIFELANNLRDLDYKYTNLDRVKAQHLNVVKHGDFSLNALEEPKDEDEAQKSIAVERDTPETWALLHETLLENDKQKEHREKAEKDDRDRMVAQLTNSRYKLKDVYRWTGVPYKVDLELVHADIVVKLIKNELALDIHSDQRAVKWLAKHNTDIVYSDIENGAQPTKKESLVLFLKEYFNFANDEFIPTDKRYQDGIAKETLGRLYKQWREAMGYKHFLYIDKNDEVENFLEDLGCPLGYANKTKIDYQIVTDDGKPVGRDTQVIFNITPKEKYLQK